ncbi:MAG TPA: DUF559 domain-containing protein [Sphingomonas sp.]|nr:DUF559 domain-containing protein [Sphingomonas sp.]
MHGEGDRTQCGGGVVAPRATIERARGLRRRMTLLEVRLWVMLRMRPDGLRFRRRHPLGRYVLDFYCPQARLAIEVDGMAHEWGDGPAHEAVRDAWLAGQGIATLRIPASDVLKEPEAVLRLIVERCARPLHRPADGPPPRARHGEGE